jgi:acetyl-CoA carboxylase carboxyl transferase subunit alpha
MSHVLTFERSVVTLLTRIDELRVSSDDDPKVISEIERLESQAGELVRELYANLTPMQKVLLSRHPNRPYSLDYIERLSKNWVELHGDRRYADDSAIVAGLGSYRGRSVVFVGQQKGRTTKENVKRNFGMASPEGYRKALRLYDMADRFGLPIITFIDTAGAYPGIGAEERGQSEAIAACLEKLASVRVPVISVVIGEGGSGGALALGVGNRVLVLEYAYYSVITPEGCAAILWKDPNKIAEAAARLKITATDLLALGVVDGIVEEPSGGAHRDFDEAALHLDAALARHLGELEALGPSELREDRYARFRKIGAFASA